MYVRIIPLLQVLVPKSTTVITHGHKKERMYASAYGTPLPGPRWVTLVVIVVRGPDSADGWGDKNPVKR